MALPVLSNVDKRMALEKAQHMRSQRAQLRRQLKHGELSLEDVFNRMDEDVIGKMRVLYLIESLPQVGRVTSRRIMNDIGINQNRRVKGLGARQKRELLQRMH